MKDVHGKVREHTYLVQVRRIVEVHIPLGVITEDGVIVIRGKDNGSAWHKTSADVREEARGARRTALPPAHDAGSDGVGRNSMIGGLERDSRVLKESVELWDELLPNKVPVSSAPRLEPIQAITHSSRTTRKLPAPKVSHFIRNKI